MIWLDILVHLSTCSFSTCTAGFQTRAPPACWWLLGKCGRLTNRQPTHEWQCLMWTSGTVSTCLSPPTRTTPTSWHIFICRLLHLWTSTLSRALSSSLTLWHTWTNTSTLLRLASVSFYTARILRVSIAFSWKKSWLVKRQFMKNVQFLVILCKLLFLLSLTA